MPPTIADVLPQDAAPSLSATSDMPGAEPVVEPTPDPPPPEPAPPSPPPAPEPAKPVEPSPINKRFSEITAERRAAEARADQLAALLEKAISRLDAPKVETKPADEPKPPKREDFADPYEYAERLSEWTAKQTADRTVEELERKRKADDERAQRDRLERDTKAQNDAIAAEWNKKCEEFVKTAPDYYEVTDKEEVPVSMPMVHALLNSDQGPAIAYHLAKNPDEARRIANIQNPVKVVYEIGRIAARLEQPPKVEISNAPDPITPVGSRERSSERTPDEMTTEEYARWAATRTNNPVKLHPKILGTA